MTSLTAFPKIWHIGTPQSERLLNGPVEVTEKLDGSQIAWHYDGTELTIRSKGAMLSLATVDKLFTPAVNHLTTLASSSKLPVGYTFWGETLHAPKHNTLRYNRIPNNHIAIFGGRNPKGIFLTHERLTEVALSLDLDVVPIIYEGPLDQSSLLDTLTNYLKRESFLGGAEIEGVVIKNYNESLLIGGQFIPLLAGKYVSEAFKEKHRENWQSYGDKVTAYIQSYRSPARYLKSVQFLRDAGQLEHSPRDIGKLLKHLQEDFEEEVAAEAKEWLWNHYRKDFLRALTRGFPEWYKQHLVEDMQCSSHSPSSSS